MTGTAGNSTQIIEQTKAFGASSAGIARVSTLLESPSYAIYQNAPRYGGYSELPWPQAARTVLVFALPHDRSDPSLDWWNEDIEGRTKGNRELIAIARRIKDWLREECAITSWPLPYQVEQGGVLLKDAAVMAGLGIIGKNNLLITPDFGPRVRLRAMFLDRDLDPTGPVDFAPCEGCPMPCLRACPQDAFRDDDQYKLVHCDRQMNKDVDNRVTVDDWEDGAPGVVVQYCRACELACPVPVH